MKLIFFWWTSSLSKFWWEGRGEEEEIHYLIQCILPVLYL